MGPAAKTNQVTDCESRLFLTSKEKKQRQLVRDKKVSTSKTSFYAFAVSAKFQCAEPSALPSPFSFPSSKRLRIKTRETQWLLRVCVAPVRPSNLKHTKSSVASSLGC